MATRRMEAPEAQSDYSKTTNYEDSNHPANLTPGGGAQAGMYGGIGE